MFGGNETEWSASVFFCCFFININETLEWSKQNTVMCKILFISKTWVCCCVDEALLVFSVVWFDSCSWKFSPTCQVGRKESQQSQVRNTLMHMKALWLIYLLFVKRTHCAFIPKAAYLEYFLPLLDHFVSHSSGQQHCPIWCPSFSQTWRLEGLFQYWDLLILCSHFWCVIVTSQEIYLFFQWSSFVPFL